MNEEIRALSKSLKRATLEVVWRQWKALGASTTVRVDKEKRLQSLIDPEALLLVSLLLMDDEPRLHEIVPDWMAANSDLLSVQRVKNLAKGYHRNRTDPLQELLSWLASKTLEGGRDLRWKSLAGANRGRGQTRANRGQSKRRAVRARLIEPVTLMLRLRLGLGVGVKADLIAYLLGKGEDALSVRAISNATAYSAAGVRRAADDLAAARLIISVDDQPSGYRINRSAWTDLLALDIGAPPVWPNWHQRFIFVIEFDRWVREVEKHPVTAYAFGVHGRELLERHRPVFQRDLVLSWSGYTDIPDWGSFVTHAVQSLAARMTEWA